MHGQDKSLMFTAFDDAIASRLGYPKNGYLELALHDWFKSLSTFLSRGWIILQGGGLKATNANAG